MQVILDIAEKIIRHISHTPQSHLMNSELGHWEQKEEPLFIAAIMSGIMFDWIMFDWAASLAPIPLLFLRN
jgi:hypothetical protein